MKSERINLLVTPEEKAVIDKRARDAGLTTSEMIRRAALAYDPEVDGELRTLVDELAAVADRMEAKLDATLAKVAAYEEALEARDLRKKAARAELEASGLEWPFGLPEQDPPARAAP